MPGEKRKPIKFILCFTGISGVLLLFWQIIHPVYLRLLVFAGNAVWKLIGFPVIMSVSDERLHFIYRFAVREPLSFTVTDADEIYLNLIILLALIGATRLSARVRVAKPALASTCVLFIFHLFMLTAYAHTHIWTFMEAQGADARRELMRHVKPLFSQNFSGYFETVLFHWNTWGWDVMPIVIWAAVLYASGDYRPALDGYLRALLKKGG